MPTGYTAKLMSEGQDFRAFVLTCARGFGACIMQRDDPMDQPPAKQEPSDWNAKRLNEARALLLTLTAMNNDERIAYGVARRAEAIKSAQDSIATAEAENARLDDMAGQVTAWMPPTTDHDGLRKFMLDQIEISHNSLAWSRERLRESEDKSPAAFYAEAVAAAEHSIDYHIRENAKEVERTNSRNDWIEQLYNSLEK